MLRSLQIADQIARTGHMPVRRLDLIWISARNAARRELDLGVAALVEAVTLLTADVEGSTRLSQTRLNELAADYPTLDQNISEAVAAHGGVTRPVDQEVGSGLVVAFLRAGDAIACALELQLSTLAPMRPRVGVHTGDVRLRGDGTITGSAINESACLRDLAHEGQTLLSAATGDLVIDQLPANTWLTDVGKYPLRGLHRQERVIQLCHRDLRNEFPPLRMSVGNRSSLPAQFTTFVGRDAQINEVQEVLTNYRLVTLRGEGGVGKTRLAIQIAAASEFRDGLCFVDLAPIADPGMVSTTAAHALGLIDRPGSSTFDTLSHAIGNCHMLMVLDNCEHVLDACAELVVELLGACPELSILATSRESIGVTGEVTWVVPSLSPANEAIQLFTERARLVQPNFEIVADNFDAVSEICRRLDGMPLAIELAAARLRSLSPNEIANSLDDRFRLLTGGARSTAHHELMAQAALVRGDVTTARRFADEAVLASTGWHLMMALIARARVAIAQDELGKARDDAHAAVACGVGVQTYLAMPDALELLAGLAGEAGNHGQAVRLFGAAAAQRQRTGEVRHKIWDAGYEAATAALRDAMGDEDFTAAWAEGAAAPLDEAIAYAQRGRGERKRPSNGWDALTPAEHKIVKLVTEGLVTKDIAARLFVSPRTVQTHLTHIYTKLDVTSRVQLVQEAAQHST